jgi:acetyl-CoA carboxylase alpha subunit
MNCYRISIKYVPVVTAVVGRGTGGPGVYWQAGNAGD